MATTVGSHSVSAFATPVNGGPLDANVVRGNDNTIRTAYVAHDADTGIHVQSSTLASRPSAGTAGRKWITADTGVYKLWYDDGTTWHEVAAGNIDVFVIAGENLVKGDVVKVTGYNSGTGAPTVAKIASASDTAFGIVNSTTIANGATGYLTNTGLILDVDTQAFSIGNILYPNTSGGLTATKPTSGNYQPVAYVLRSNQNNGVLYVEFSAPRIVERSDNTASTIVLRDASGNFSAGTITAGAVTSTGLVTFASLKGTGATTVTNILDEDNMASDSATALATQQSIKAYVDAQVATVDTLSEVLANGNTTGANDIIVTAGQKVTTDTIAETTSGAGVTIDSVLLKDDVVNATDIETGTISANDGTASATIANSTGVMTIASSVLTTTDINGGTIDGTTIGGSSAAAGTFTTVGATTGNITTVNATTVDTTSIEVTNVKAKDGTASITIADSTGVATISAAPVLSALTASQAVFTDASKGLVSNAITGTGNVVMSASPTLTGTVTAATLNATTLGGTLSTAAQPNVTSVGTLTSLTVSGDLTVDTSTLKVDSTNNWVGIGTASPAINLDVSDVTNATLRLSSTKNDSSWNTSTDAFGKIEWYSADTSGDASVRAAIWATPGASTGASSTLTFWTKDVTSSYPVERVRITEGGSLVIGNGNTNASPAVGNLRGTNGTGTDIAGGEFRITGGRGTGSGEGGPITFYTSAAGASGTTLQTATERMRLGASGNLAVDGTTFNVDATNNRVGIGTATPDVQLELRTLNTTGNTNVATLRFRDEDTSQQTGQLSGQIQFYSSDVTGPTGVYSAIRGGAEGTNGQGFLSIETGVAGSATEAARIDASGNLGVGATSPTAYTGGTRVLHVNGTGDTDIKLTNSTTGTGATDGLLLRMGSNDAYVWNCETNGSLIFATVNTERARITSGGYFKASNTGAYLNATGTYHEFRNSVIGTVAAITTSASSYTANILYIDATATAAGTGFGLISAQASGVEQFRVRGDGTIFAQNTTVQSLSDARLKDNVVDATDGLNVITALRPVRFDWKSGYGNDRTNQLGFIAQEVEAVFPEAVSEWAMDEPTGEVDEDGKPITEKVDYKTVGPGALIPVLVKAIQELEARIAVLEAQA